MNRDEREKMTVLQHAGRSYVRCDYNSAVYYHTASGQGAIATGLFINGKHARSYPVSCGDDDYLEIKGAVMRVEKRLFPKSIVVSYEANAEFTGIKTPISIDEYKVIDSDRASLLYHPVHRNEPQDPIPFPFETLDLDTVPKKFPEGVLVTVPDYLRRVRSTWHTLPCQFDPKHLFKLLVEAVGEEIKGKPHFTSTVYDHNHSITVAARVDVHGFPKNMGVSIFTYSFDGSYSTSRLPTLAGDDLAKLMAHVEAWIQRHRQMIRDIHTPTACPCCGQKVPKGMTLVTASPRRN